LEWDSVGRWAVQRAAVKAAYRADAKESCWVEWMAGGKVARKGHERAGERESWWAASRGEWMVAC
jgi:hypothetical protein